ncbi:Rrf2 family transcriptional regulator [uncultured Flavobacterium sp.]|uniref:RrF2 family transcriptional regulator n=1 Tax=uncultured Flavobacterium sp. TaxID=165435 RepID=UPI0030ECCEB3|tara:strand:- start:203836 stop:204270 length:435 start_codon:yes stop_codon:yes gene_type:complete
MFSKSCEYGIRATIFIASKCCENRRVGLKEIAIAIDSPLAFTAKILQILSKNKIINSTKGVNGGFEIFQKNLKSINLMQIIEAIDGNSVFLGCGLGLENCSDTHPCPVHNEFKVIKAELKSMLENTTLEKLALNLKSGSFFLKY